MELKSYSLKQISELHCSKKPPSFESEGIKCWKDHKIIVVDVKKYIFENHLMSKRKVCYKRELRLPNNDLIGYKHHIFCGIDSKDEYFNLGEGSFKNSPYYYNELLLDNSIGENIWNIIGWSDKELSELRINNHPLPKDLIEIIIEDHWLPYEATKGFTQSFPKGLIEMHKSIESFYDVYSDGYAREGFGLDSSKNRGGDIPDHLLDIDKMVCIGQVDYEVFVCLDFRRSIENPAVVALTGGEKGPWQIIAKDVNDFSNKIKNNGIHYFRVE
tara:strand:+ start:255 stop:1070 length:816 start_codon:yes stop_codon:yes gene_type:complete